MGISRKKTRRGALRRSFALSIVLCLLSALLLSGATALLCEWWAGNIYKSYLVLQDAGLITAANLRDAYSHRDLLLERVLRTAQYGLIPVWLTACISVTGTLFYRRRLNRPIGLLEEASQKLAENDLDFYRARSGRG